MICDALRILQGELKPWSKNTAHALKAIKSEVKNNIIAIYQVVSNIQLNMHAEEKVRAAARAAVEVESRTCK